MWRLMVSVTIAAAALLGASGCGTTRPLQQDSSSAQREEAPTIEGIHYTTIVFDEGKSTLKIRNRKDLEKLAKKAQKQKAPIEEIRILAWSDHEYPDKVTGRTSGQDIAIASDRAAAIKDFLESKLEDANDIDSYNMARRPDLLSKLLRDDEYKVKEAFETSEATGTQLPDGSISYTKASKAIVIIDYEGQ